MYVYVLIVFIFFPGLMMVDTTFGLDVIAHMIRRVHLVFHSISFSEVIPVLRRS